MSRLIDADAFEKFIKEKYKDGESTDDIKDQVLFDLSYQPIAYDVEKVVAELEEKQYQAEKDMGLSEDIDEMNGYGGMSMAYETAIDIVKRGGVEWKK